MTSVVKPPVRATITQSGVPGRSEPYALLADGRTMPMGRNMGDTFVVGQQGEAQYVMTGSGGLWRFTPDADPVGWQLRIALDEDDDEIVEAYAQGVANRLGQEVELLRDGEVQTTFTPTKGK